MPRLTPPARAGSVSTATLIALPVTLLMLGVAIFFALARESKAEAQNAADAAALAATHALATDDLLVDNLDRTKARLAGAEAVAQKLAQQNFAHGKRLSVAANPKYAPDGDTVFGSLSSPTDTFTPFDPQTAPAAPVNAVRVIVSGPQVRAPLGGPTSSQNLRAQATAMLDFRVVGFRPTSAEAVPLVPLGLYDGTDNDGKNSWHPLLKTAPDRWTYDAEKKQFVRAPNGDAGDGIPEVTVVLGQPTDASVAGALLNLGIEPSAEDGFAQTVAQFGTGVTSAQFKKWGGEFVLGADNKISIPGTTAGSAASADLVTALREVVTSGQPRIWPLFAGGSDDGSGMRFDVTGWVGARLLSVDVVKDVGIVLVLQPAVVCLPAVVTEPAKVDPPAFWATNRTVCRVRLAH